MQNRSRKGWNGGGREEALRLARQRIEKAIADGAIRCPTCQGTQMAGDNLCPECRGAGCSWPGGRPPPPWQPIETAPKEWTREHSFELDGRTITIRNGPAIRVRKDVKEQEWSAIVCWAQQEGFDHGQEPHWWNLIMEQPCGWTPTEWRPLTTEEEAQLDHPGNTGAPAASASPPPPPPAAPADSPEMQEARKQVFGWAWRANGGSLASWAERWGRIMWLSGQPEGTDPDGVITADLGDGWTLNQDLALDWDLNRTSYTRLAASIIRQMAKEAGYEIQGSPI